MVYAKYSTNIFWCQYFCGGVNITFSETLSQLRKNQGLTQKQAATIFGLSYYGYQRYEYGDSEPSLGVATKIADYFAVSLDYLTGRTDNPKINR